MFKQRKKLNNSIEVVTTFLHDKYDYIYHGYDVNIKENKEAKKVIKEFYKCLLTIKHEKKSVENFHYFTYLDRLILLDISMKNQKYIDVCNDIVSFNHYENVLQDRVLYGISNMLKKYF